MQDVLNEFTSPVWWVSVVFVGLLINIISAYAKPGIDALLSRLSGWWTSRSKKSRERFERQSLAAAKLPIFALTIHSQQTFDLTLGLIYFLFAAFLANWGVEENHMMILSLGVHGEQYAPKLYAGATVCALLAVSSVTAAFSSRRLLLAALQKTADEL